MLRKFKTTIITLMVSFGFVLPGIVGTVTYAATLGAPTTTDATTAGGSDNASTASSGACTGANLSLDVDNTSDSDCGANQAADTSSLDTVLTYVLNIFSVIVGLVAVIMIVVGGLKYIISGGESGKVSGAKDTILFAIVGLVVVALAQIIVRFVLANISGKAGLSGGATTTGG